MHLPKLPTLFTKNGEVRQAFFTVQARELMAAGWVEKVDEVQVVKAKAKVAEKKETLKKKQAVKKKVASVPVEETEQLAPISPLKGEATPSSVEE